MAFSSDYARTIDIWLTNTKPDDKDNIVRSLILQVMQGIPPNEDIRLWGFQKLPFPLKAGDREILKESWRQFLPKDHPDSLNAEAEDQRQDSHVNETRDLESSRSSSKRTASTAFGTNPWRYVDSSASAPTATMVLPPRNIPKLSPTAPTEHIGPVELDPDPPSRQSSAKWPRRFKAAHSSQAAVAPPPRRSARRKYKRPTASERQAPTYRPRMATSIRTYEVMDEEDTGRGVSDDSQATLSMEEGQEH